MTSDLFGIQKIEDFQILHTLFSREVAGLASENAPKEILQLSQEIQPLRIGPTGELEWRFNSTDFYETSRVGPLPADESDKFKKIEGAILETLARKVMEIQSSTTADVEALSSKLSALKTAESQMQVHILGDKNGESYASAYNNIAQLKRLSYAIETVKRSYESDESFSNNEINRFEESIFSLLEKAISLLSPKRPEEAPAFVQVSEDQIRVLKSAYGQLSAIAYQRANRYKMICASSRLPPTFTADKKLKLQMSAFSLESQLSEYAAISGKLGDPIASKHAVSINPMAKLCGAIVRESMINSCEH